MYFGIHVKCLLFLSDFNEIWIFFSDFRKYSNIKFHDNPSSGSRVLHAYRETDGWTDRDMTKITVPFRNFANAPSKRTHDTLGAVAEMWGYGKMFVLLFGTCHRHRRASEPTCTYVQQSDLLKSAWHAFVKFAEIYRNNFDLILTLQNYFFDLVLLTKLWNEYVTEVLFK